MSHNANRKYMGANDGSYDSKLDFEQDPFRNIDDWDATKTELYSGRKELVPEFGQVQKELVIVCLIYVVGITVLLVGLHSFKDKDITQKDAVIVIDGDCYPEYVADKFEEISQWGKIKKEQDNGK